MNRRFLSVVAASLLAVPLFISQVLAAEQPRDRDNNAVIYGGAYTKAELIDKWKNGDGKNSTASISEAMQWAGATQVEVQQSVDGVVRKDGSVWVGDKQVAKDAVTLGREQKNPNEQRIGQFYARPAGDNFAVSSIEAFVYMPNGKFEWAIIKSCGNPVKATPTAQPVKPVEKSFDCTGLTMEEIGERTYRFTGTAEVKNTKVEAFIFEFGDGNTKTVTTSSNSAVAEHTYAKAGTYTAKVRVKTGAGTSQYEEICSKTVTIEEKEVPQPTKPVVIEKPVIVEKEVEKIVHQPVIVEKEVVRPVVLPETGGPGALAGAVGLSAMGAGVYGWRRTRAKLLDALKEL